MPPVTSSAPQSQQQASPRENPATAWILAAPGAGDNRQLETLADLVGVRTRWVGRPDPVGRVLFDRLAGWRAGDIPAAKREAFAPPWPDLVLIAGGRGVIDARRVRNASGGRSRIICVGRPWAPLDWFDLVVTTPQYRLPEADNLLTIDLPLNRPKSPGADELAYWRAEFAPLPRPMVGVLLGGHSGSYRFTDGRARRLAGELNGLLADAGGSAVLVASPRTPERAVDVLEAALEIPARICRWRADARNPLASLLALADAYVVTGDSASMLAEACHGGKPVAVFDLHERFRSRLNASLRRATPFLQPALQDLTRKGLWFPARDMPGLHRRARATGRAVPLDTLLDAGRDQPAELRVGPVEDRVAERVHELL